LPQQILTAANGLGVRNALELAGVEFIDENGGGPGRAAARKLFAVKVQAIEIAEPT